LVGSQAEVAEAEQLLGLISTEAADALDASRGKLILIAWQHEVSATLMEQETLLVVPLVVSCMIVGVGEPLQDLAIVAVVCAFAEGMATRATLKRSQEQLVPLVTQLVKDRSFVPCWDMLRCLRRVSAVWCTSVYFR
jgi:hypothetical protein